MSKELTQTGGKLFDPTEGNIYFLASSTHRQEHGAVGRHRHLLIAVNEIGGENDLETIESWSQYETRVFLDSGVFNLATQFAKAQSISMDVALSTAPADVPGFDALFEKYVSVVQRIGPQLWGYIEIDQGGRENKIKTREKLEAMGLRPIPVYHPLNDGWEYFDYLAERYDRICFGNIVQAEAETRRRLLATAWERRRKYPHLWIHLLGMTPNEQLNAYPINSCDSSTWLSCVRWPDTDNDRACLKPLGRMPRDFAYVLGSDNDGETGDRKAVALSAYKCNLNQRNWRNHISALESLGCDARGGVLP